MSGEYPDYPRLAVGGVVIHNGRVLLVKRDKPPSRGEWAIPGGSVELGEKMSEAVEREILEETGVTIRVGEVCHWFEDFRRDEQGRIRFHYVIVDFMGEYLHGEPGASSDAAAAAWIDCRRLDELKVNKNTVLLLRKLGLAP